MDPDLLPPKIHNLLQEGNAHRLSPRPAPRRTRSNVNSCSRTTVTSQQCLKQNNGSSGRVQKQHFPSKGSRPNGNLPSLLSVKIPLPIEQIPGPSKQSQHHLPSRGSHSNRRRIHNSRNKIREDSTQTTTVVENLSTSVESPRRNNQRKFIIGFKKLFEWNNNQSTETVLLDLISKQDIFADLLNTNLEQDWIVMIISILSKVFSLPFMENNISIMTIAIKQSFVSQLQKYVAMLQYEDFKGKQRNKFFWENSEEFFVNLAIFCNSLLGTLPTKACEFLPKLLKIVNDMLPGFASQHHIHLSTDTINEFKSLAEKLTLCQEELEKKKTVVKRDYEEEAPPDDFRSLSIYPTCQEILSRQRSFIRKNIIEGAYDDVEHYLDVQFRLLKEDFVAPLRQGIADYFDLQSGDKKFKRLSSVQIHKEVVFLAPKFINDQVGVSLKFMVKDASKIFNPYSKRLLYGSLMCFTRDNFETVMFGKILDKDIKNHQLVIEFQPEHNTYELNVPYMMLECKIYFEPYYHVLKALQCISELDFPMKSYLIDVNSKVEPPNYLEPDTIFKIHNKDVQLFSPFWPSAEQFNLNPTQYSAFKSALTQKFVVIQGPPGTGKTYLGLEIVKTLLHPFNISSWYNKTPILVVCYTNHALDQFLEGLISVTKRIVRIGGQSKNEQLKQFQLINQRKLFMGNKYSVGDALYSCRRELSTLLSEIKFFSEQINRIERFDSILNFAMFARFDMELQRSWFSRATQKDLLSWLCGGNENRNVIVNVNNTVNLSKRDLLNDQVDDSDVDYDEDEEENINRQINIDDDFEFETLSGVSDLIKISDLERNVRIILAELNDENSEINHPEKLKIKLDVQKSLTESFNLLELLKDKLQEGQLAHPPRKPAYVNYRYPNNMRSADRWNLYFYWLHTYRNILVNNLLKLQYKHHGVHKRYAEIRNINDTELMKQMLVVGMTTTGAARLQTTLQALKCRIVVVEEAAEVLESHVTVSLTNHCQHLILIGDHQQLRPSTADYHMEKKFNLGISMFERMVLNKIQCNVLGVQHRMRPEIASLIVPTIYPKLENHVSVENLPSVRGVDTNLFFIHHTNPEIQSNDESKSNLQEAKFLINLAKYLIQNGYKPEEITILSAYSGQMFTLRAERKKCAMLLSDVRISVLDNYQGEECKIILLSLVRNNEEGKIGFLKIENRVCVALSRAKEGFYMMGNMDLLCDNSEIWPMVKETLEKQGNLGTHLTLRCQIHPDQVTQLSKHQDFNLVPEGGCNRICGTQMNCAHYCTRACHVLDREHITTKCKAPCSKDICDNEHKCPKKCFEDCGDCMVPVKRELKCGHTTELPCHVNVDEYECKTLVTATLECGHEVNNKHCYKNVKYWKCPFPCDTRVEPCGHSCLLTCHVKDDPDHINYKCYKKCERNPEGCTTNTHKCKKSCYEPCLPCQIVVKKKLPNCNHVVDMVCCESVDEMECIKQCQKMIEACGHNCKRKCYEPCGGCTIMVPKIIPLCGHEVRTKCSEQPNRLNCHGACPKKLACGHTCQAKCKDPCTNLCVELVDHLTAAFCGHKFKIPCHLAPKQLTTYSNSLLKFCTEPCTKILQCTHPCSGTCGECAQGRIHATCQQKCGQILICGHECDTPCREVCQPCQKMCSLKCRHSKCKKTCGASCTTCREPCDRRCKHRRCRAICGKLCTIPPCEEPCPELLICGHPCVGFCGDPCPPLCRICHKEELTEIFLGNEDDEDARFVLLIECNHVIESTGMETYCRQDEEAGTTAIKYRRCPKCLTPLTSTLRYSDYVKRAIRDVINIKKKTAGNPVEHRTKQEELSLKLMTIRRLQSGWVFSKSSELIRFVHGCSNLLKSVNNGKRQTFDLMKGKTLEAKITIVQNIAEILESQELEVYKPHTTLFTYLKTEIVNEAVEYFDFLLKKLTKSIDRITSQEILDFEREQARVQKIAQFLHIISSYTVSADHKTVRELIYKPIAFTETFDAEVKASLNELHKKIRGFNAPPTEMELRAIVQATGVKQGAWYKCKNGHYFAIGDCGGANQISKCIECGERVGGENHALLSDNRHAGEMDGSRFAAWSTQANDMQNFIFDD